jgi:hypothetical protein
MRSKLAMLAASFSVVIAMSACDGGSTDSGSPESQLMQARDKLSADLKECTAKYGYDPNQVSSVPETALAPNELEWRQCAYSAVRAYERLNPSLSRLYENLIAEDMSMTAAIQQGTMTRSQRRDRIDTLVDQIKAAEQNQAAAATMAQAQQNEQVRRVVTGIRGLH